MNSEFCQWLDLPNNYRIILNAPFLKHLRVLRLNQETDVYYFVFRSRSSIPNCFEVKIISTDDQPCAALKKSVIQKRLLDKIAKFILGF